MDDDRMQDAAEAVSDAAQSVSAIAQDFMYDGPRGWTRGLEDLTSAITRLQSAHRALERAVRDEQKGARA